MENNNFKTEFDAARQIMEGLREKAKKRLEVLRRDLESCRQMVADIKAEIQQIGEAIPGLVPEAELRLERKRRPTETRAMKYLKDHPGQWIRGIDLMAAIGSRRFAHKALNRCVATGRVEVRGRTMAREYRLIPPNETADVPTNGTTTDKEQSP